MNLRKESEEIGKVLKLAKSEKNRLSDADDATNLADLTVQLDGYNSQCEDEKRRIKDLDSEVGFVWVGSESGWGGDQG